MKRVLTLLLLSMSVAATAAKQDVPTKKAAKYDAAYFKTLQTKRVASTKDVTWRNFGPAMSGYCDEFWIHPTNADYMYTTLDMGNCYFTDNNAESWLTIHDWDGSGEGNRIGWVDFSRQDPTFGMAIDEKGYLMKTFNQGRTFQRVEVPSYPQRSGHGKKSVITVDPTNDNNWYIGAGQGWRVKFTRFSLKYPHNTKFRNTDYGYILVTKDKGKSWKEVRVGFDDLDVFRIFVNPKQPKEVYAFTNNGFYKSVNAGKSFQRTGKGLPYNVTRDGAMHYDPKSGKVTLYLLEQTNYIDKGTTVESRGGVYRSDDKGESWSNITGDLAIDYSILNKTYHIKTQYYKTIAHWFGISIKEATQKYKVPAKSLLSSFNRLIVNPLNPNEICVSNNIKHDVSMGPVEMWKSDDGGKHWYPTMRNGSYWGKQIDKEYWLSRGDGKDDLGRNMTFAHLEREMREDMVFVGARYAEFNCRGEMLVVMEQQVLRSTDGGKSFQQIDDIESTPGNWVGKGCSNLPGEGLEHETGMRRPMLRSGEHGLWTIGDMGDCKYDGVAVKQLTGQGKATNDARSISAVAVNPQDTNNIFILMFRQNFRGFLRESKDCGETWSTVNPDVPVIDYDRRSQEHMHQHDLTIDPKNPKRMYVAIPRLHYSNHSSTQYSPNAPKTYDKSRYGMLRTDDGGFTWELANNGLPTDSSIGRIEMDPMDNKTLYATYVGKFNNTAKPTKVIGGALYRTTNGGDSWEKMKIPSVIECVSHCYVDSNTGEIYLSAGQANGLPEAGGVWSSRNGGKSWQKIFEMPYVKDCYTSMVDPNLIVVNVGSCRKIGILNPGVHLSRDGGSTWVKANFELGQPCRINAVRPDIYDKSILWCALYGSGWYKGTIK